MARNRSPEETQERILTKAQALFIEKGYENCSIQDILNALGDLSKGAIYHHFKSKEEIFEAVCERIGRANDRYFAAIRDAQGKSGLEKLKQMMFASCTNPNNDAAISLIKSFLNEPRFFKSHVLEIYEEISPIYIQPIIEEGLRDGSLHTDYPQELAEVLTTLLNLWINPLITKSTPAGLRRKLAFFDQILHGLGLPLLDEALTDSLLQLCLHYQAD